MTWKTLNTRSVLAQVHSTAKVQLSLGLFEHAECKHLRECLIGRPPQNGDATKANDLTGIEDVRSAPRLVDGGYTDLHITWRGIHFRCRSASLGRDLVLRIDPDPETLPLVPPLLTVELSLLWNAEGSVTRKTNSLAFRTPEADGEIFCTAPFSDQAVADLGGAHATLRLEGPIGISTRKSRSLEEIDAILEGGHLHRDRILADYGSGEIPELAGAVHSALGWTGVYDPLNRRTVTTVSRVWAARNNGAVIFCWDSFFAAMMAQALGEHSLAVDNLEAITSPIDTLGYIPNVLNAAGSATFGHSQPPVGSWAVRYVSEASGHPELGSRFIDRLLTWNRWWPENRVHEGYLCWGSRREALRVGGNYEERSTGTKSGAAFESGLDNTPMFDDAVYDQDSGLLLQADVGLQALYIRDCQDLAMLCERNGRSKDAKELRERAERFLAKLEDLWDEVSGIYLNRDLVTGTLSPRLSPCNFYPLLTGCITPDRVERMLCNHFHNPEEFVGEYMLPSIARNDPAYPDQSYWRGRVWAPMNFLVYGGLVSSGCREEARQLAKCGNALLLRNWRKHGFIGENYHGDTGKTGERANSDPFNPWGALLGLIGLMDAKAVPPLPKM